MVPNTRASIVVAARIITTTIAVMPVVSPVLGVVAGAVVPAAVVVPAGAVVAAGTVVAGAVVAGAVVAGAVVAGAVVAGAVVAGAVVAGAVVAGAVVAVVVGAAVVGAGALIQRETLSTVMLSLPTSGPSEGSRKHIRTLACVAPAGATAPVAVMEVHSLFVRSSEFTNFKPSDKRVVVSALPLHWHYKLHQQ